jgi:hypothetical protein
MQMAELKGSIYHFGTPHSFKIMYKAIIQKAEKALLIMF